MAQEAAYECDRCGNRQPEMYSVTIYRVDQPDESLFLCDHCLRKIDNLYPDHDGYRKTLYPIEGRDED